MIQLKGITSAHVQRLIGLPFRIMFLTLLYLVHEYVAKNLIPYYRLKYEVDDDDEFRFNDASTHEGHLHQNGTNMVLTSHMREFNAVDQKVFHRKRFITADTKWLIFSFE